jgi:hypothetical protein
MRALERANSVRLARAELKRRIADGDVSAAAIILGCPGEVKRWTVSELLLSQRRWGTTRCRRFLESFQISEIKPIGDLTDRQRRLLVTALGGCAEPMTSIAELHGGAGESGTDGTDRVHGNVDGTPFPEAADASPGRVPTGQAASRALTYV